LIHSRSSFLSREGRLGVSVDWLTGSVSSADAEAILMPHTEPDEPGTARPGFRRSERRLTLGGRVWRRLEPLQPSKRFGDDYESWEFDGCQAAHGVDLMARCDRPKVTRIDLAFDFSVRDVTARELVETIIDDREDVKTPQGFGVGESGQRPHLTMYIGSMSSDRRIRIYRKDVQSPHFAFGCGPIMRVELMLKGRQAHAFWQVFGDDRQAGYAAAAAHIREMSGLIVADDIGTVPEFVAAEIPDDAQRLFTFLEQHGTTLHEFASSGVDLAALAAQRCESISRMTRHRSKQRTERLRAAGPKLVEQIVRRMLASSC